MFKYVLLLCCVASFVFAEEGLTNLNKSMFSSIGLQKFSEGTLSREVNYIDFENWQNSIGKKISLSKWRGYNQSPWRSYFDSDSKDCAERWYISLGPLGLHTRMHDRTWGVFKGQQQIFPKFLCDGNELILNHFEVVGVKPGSPASGIIKKGDLVIAMDNQPLLSAQHTYLGQVMDNRNKRGLEIHAGQTIDSAEGKGEIELTLLRLNTQQKQQLESLYKGKRQWQKLTTIDAGKEKKVALPECDQLRIVLGRGSSLGKVWLTGNGVRHPLRSSKKKGSDNKTALEVPKGKWTLEFELSKDSSKPILVEVSQKVPFPSELRPFMKKVTLKLPKIGAFGKSFDPNSDKAMNYARMLAHRIAVQQENDGSWRAKSYASPSFYTSICGLALLSTGEDKYKDQIRKAARYVAYGPNQDKWTYSNGMWLTFLAEYYLKTKDESILPGLRKIVERCRLFVLNDYTAGHSMGKPGYGGSGYIGGGGVLALGFALASYTPAMTEDDKVLLDRMLSRIQEIAPHGKVPYGRGGKKLETTPDPGQGGSCGTGPYFLASLIRGGTKHFTTTAGKRYSTAPWGSAENGHATQTLHYFWAMLSSANCSDTAYRESMNAYLWKFTTLREYDGFINENNYRTEYHNGDGVIGAPYWRTAGFLIILNAWRRNLGITGQAALRSESFHQTSVSFHRDVAAKNFYKRNWALVANVLGSKAPESFKDAYSKLKSLPSDRQLGKNLGILLKSQVKSAVKEILAMPQVSPDISNAQLCELMYGVGFHASCVPSASLPADGKIDNKEEKKDLKNKQKKLKKMLASGKHGELEHLLRIKPFSINESIPGLEEVLPLRMDNLKVSVKDLSGKFLKTPVSKSFGVYFAKMAGKKTVPQNLSVKLADMNTGSKITFEVAVGYEIMGQKISYKTKLICPQPEARNYTPYLTKVKVRGHVSTDYIGQASTKVVLQNGDLVGCETRFRPADYLPAGAPVEFEISPDNVWAHVVRSAKLLNPSFKHIQYTAGSKLNLSQGHKIGKEKTSIEISFSPNLVGSIYTDLGGGKLNRHYTVFLKVGEEWQEVTKCEADGWQYLVRKSTATGLKIVFDEGKELTLRKLSILQPTKNISSSKFW